MTGGGAGHSHSHDHDHDDEMGVSLQAHIDMSQVYCLNEHETNAGRSVLKSHADRLTLEPNLQSPRDGDDDEDLELLMYVPFSESVSIKYVTISGRASLYVPSNGNRDEATSAPCTVKVFANRNDIDFDTARDIEADATLELVPPEHMSELHGRELDDDAANPDEGTFGASLDYPLRPIRPGDAPKFKYCNSITLFFMDNFAHRAAEADGGNGDDGVIPTEITYIGFKGVGTTMKRQAVETVYETRGMKKDHKVHGAEFGAKDSMGF